MRAVVTGGGTAGHVMPALPVIEALRAKGWQVSYVGSDSGMEARLVAPLGIPFHAIRTGKLRRYFSFANLVDAFRVPWGVLQAFRVLGRRKADVVFSKGGFVAFPVVFAAWLRRIGVVAHESDLSPGLANRLSLPFVRTLCVNFAATRARVRTVHTGTPLRAALLRGERAKGLAAAGFTGSKPILVVVGGSLGARRLNELTDRARQRLVRAFDVFHVRGAGNLSADAGGVEGYVQREFVDADAGWGDILAAADVVVSRAGANAVYELLCLGKPNLLVPLSAAASRGDQIENAAHAEALGYSMVIQEADLDADALVAAARALHRQGKAWRRALANFRPPDSVALIVREIEAAAAG